MDELTARHQKIPCWTIKASGDHTWYESQRPHGGRTVTVRVDAWLLAGEREPGLYLERQFCGAANAR